jgi:hypothetical protein
MQSDRRRRCGPLPAWLVGVGLLFLGTIARAKNPEIPVAEAVTVDGPPCVEHDALAAALSVSLGRNSLDSRIHILVHNEDAQFVSFAILRDGKVVGERRLGGEGVGCTKLRAVVSLAIATALDATLLQTRELETSPRERPPIARTPSQPPAPSPRAPRDTLSIDARALLLVDVLPTAAAGAELGVGYRPSPWFESRVSFLATTRESIPLGQAGTRANLFAGRGEACLLRGAVVLRALACAGIAAGTVHAQGYGLAPNYSIGRTWASATAGLGAEARLAPAFGLVLGIDGFVPFVAPRFEVVGPTGAITASRTTPPVGMVAGAGVVLTLL